MAGRRIEQINIVVDDVTGVVGLLRELGVGIDQIPAAWSAWNDHHHDIPASEPVDVDIDSGPFAGHWGGLPAGFTGAVVNVGTSDRDEVDVLFARAIERGAEPCRAPYDAFWGSRYAVVTIGGTAIGLRSPGDDDRRSAPPDVGTFG